MALSIAACSFYKNNGRKSLEQVLVRQFDSEKMIKNGFLTLGFEMAKMGKWGYGFCENWLYGFLG